MASDGVRHGGRSRRDRETMSEREGSRNISVKRDVCDRAFRGLRPGVVVEDAPSSAHSPSRRRPCGPGNDRRPYARLRRAPAGRECADRQLRRGQGIRDRDGARANHLSYIGDTPSAWAPISGPHDSPAITMVPPSHRTRSARVPSSVNSAMVAPSRWETAPMWGRVR